MREDPGYPFRDPTTVPLTRIEVLDFVGEAFDGPAPDRAVLVATAVDAGARDLLLDRLRALPDGPFAGPEGLWVHLPVPEDLQTCVTWRGCGHGTRHARPGSAGLGSRPVPTACPSTNRFRSAR